MMLEMLKMLKMPGNAEKCLEMLENTEAQGKGRKRRETRANKGGEIRGGSCIGPWREMVRIARRGNGEREEGGDPLGERR